MIPLISTTLITHNRLEDTKRTLESYIASTNVPYELVIVDNASTDATRDFLKAFATQNPNVQLIFNNENLYCGVARNQGFEISRGKYLHTMDNDVLHFCRWDNRVLQVFEFMPTVGQITPLKVSDSYAFESVEIEPGFCVSYSKRNTAGGSNIIRRELWDKGLRWKDIRWIPECICEDYYMSREVRALGYEFVWFTTDEYCKTLGHDKNHMVKNIDYYIDSYQKRGNLKLLEKRLEGTGFNLKHYLLEKKINIDRSLLSQLANKFRRLRSNIRLFFGDIRDYYEFKKRKIKT